MAFSKYARSLVKYVLRFDNATIKYMPDSYLLYKKLMGTVTYFSFSVCPSAKTGKIASAAIIPLYIVILVHGYSGRKFRLIVCKLYMLILTYSFEDIRSFFSGADNCEISHKQQAATRQNSADSPENPMRIDAHQKLPSAVTNLYRNH